MEVFYPGRHHLHNPPFEVYDGGEKAVYAEVPERVDRILNALGKLRGVQPIPPDKFDMAPILAVHESRYVNFLRTAFKRWLLVEGGDKSALLPATFPSYASRREPESVLGQAGLYIGDLASPIVAGTYTAAIESAWCALSGARTISNGSKAAFALCRPPGHHAGRANCGGYCYLNNAAIAAEWLSKLGKVCVLDIDYHAGNGTQEIFFERKDVFTMSIHAYPAFEYPYYSGYADEIGTGEGAGYHRNFPLPFGVNDQEYLETLDDALEALNEFDPNFLVLSAGMDIYAGDPLGKFNITRAGISAIGSRIASINKPVLVVLEGGYDLLSLGENLRTLLEPLI